MLKSQTSRPANSTRFLLAFSVTVLAFLLLIGSATVATAATTTTHFKGLTVSAFFSTVDDAGCVVSQTYVFASKFRSKTTAPASGSEAALADLYMVRYDMCSHEYLSDAHGHQLLSSQEFQVDHQLRTASLTTTMEACEFQSGLCFPVTIDLDWVATGDIIKEKHRSSFTMPGVKFSYRFDGTYRTAIADGVIASGGASLISGPSQYAQIASVKSGSLAVTK